MAEQIVEAIERKEDMGSAGARRLVRSGRIPGVIYGKGDVKPISFDAHAFSFVLRKADVGSKVQVKLGKKTYECEIKEIQEDLVKSLIKHVDFKEI
ncbi:MAG: hypothetical protein SO135_06470 [Sphaerochaetaceae bacterium]|jgi:large subunit ribosomal protein L25|nr:hypothetical protein [Sphaerochaetaceae bacterium]NLY07308.1 hypothetical protein [Spirochaetales bacterium]